MNKESINFVNEGSINFVSDIFKDIVVTGHGCACTYISDEMRIIAKMISTQV